jgi:hypothetical protein
MPIAGTVVCARWKVAPTLSTCCGDTSDSKNYLNSDKDALIQTLFEQEKGRSLPFEIKKLCSF